MNVPKNLSNTKGHKRIRTKRTETRILMSYSQRRGERESNAKKKLQKERMNETKNKKTQEDCWIHFLLICFLSFLFERVTIHSLFAFSFSSSSSSSNFFVFVPHTVWISVRWCPRLLWPVKNFTFNLICFLLHGDLLSEHPEHGWFLFFFSLSSSFASVLLDFVFLPLFLLLRKHSYTNYFRTMKWRWKQNQKKKNHHEMDLFDFVVVVIYNFSYVREEPAKKLGFITIQWAFHVSDSNVTFKCVNGSNKLWNCWTKTCRMSISSSSSSSP